LCRLQIRHGAVVHDSKEFKRDIEGFCKKNQRGRRKEKHDLEAEIKADNLKT